MKKFWMLSFVVFAGMAAAALIPMTTSGHKNKLRKSLNPVPNRYIVVLNQEIVGRSIVEPAVDAEANYLRSVHGGKVDKVYWEVLKGYSAEMTEAEAKSLSDDPRVSYVEEDGYISISSSQPDAPWNLDRVDQRSLPLGTTYDYSQDGSGVHVYILDTGIRASHSDFGGRASVAKDVLADGQNGNDCNGHGTHVAGIVGGSTYGVAKGVSIHAVRVLPCSGNGQISDLIAGINWVTANRINPAVANISITAPGTSNSLETALSNSIASGVTYTVAAGNSAWDACSYTPARTLNAITVGASAEGDDRARYSNYGSCLDLFAPGDWVTSTWIGSDTATNRMSGTSMASPMVAGVAALYLSNNRNATPATVAQYIASNATAGVVWNIDSTSPNLLLYSPSGVSTLPPPPTPTPTPISTPTATPTPTPSPTPTPTPAAKITVRKKVQNNNGNTTSNTAFPYEADFLYAQSFMLSDNESLFDPNVQVANGSRMVTVTEDQIAGWQLTSISCTETSGGQPSYQNTIVDINRKKAFIMVEPGESVDCTFTSEPLAPTAAAATISGRVIDQNGVGIRGVTMFLVDATTGQGHYASTNSFGYYSFENLQSGDFFVLRVAGRLKRMSVANPIMTFTLNGDLTDMDFVAVKGG